MAEFTYIPKNKTPQYMLLGRQRRWRWKRRRQWLGRRLGWFLGYWPSILPSDFAFGFCRRFLACQSIFSSYIASSDDFSIAAWASRFSSLRDQWTKSFIRLIISDHFDTNFASESHFTSDIAISRFVTSRSSPNQPQSTRQSHYTWIILSVYFCLIHFTSPIHIFDYSTYSQSHIAHWHSRLFNLFSLHF